MGGSDGFHIDAALDAAGSWGRFQKIVLVMSFVSAMPNAFIGMHVVFSQYEPDHHCTYPDDYINYTNISIENPEIVSTIIPYELNQENELVLSQCKMYDRNYSQYPVAEWPQMFEVDNDTKVVNCKNGITFVASETEETALVEFSMICDDDWKAPLAVSMYSVGLCFGGVFGFAADRYGRRPVFIFACAAQILSQVLDAVSWNFVMHCLSILLSGACGLLNYIVFFVLASEITDYKWRNFLTISSTYGYSVGYCSVALFAYYLRQWRYFVGFMAAASAVIYIPCCWYFPESPRWLAQRGRSDESIRYLRLIAKVNRKKEAFEKALQTHAVKRVIAKSNITETGVKETIKVLLNSGIRGRFVATVYGWFVTSTVYYALSIYSSDFSKDRFLNFFLNGLTEIPAALLGFVLIKYIGRPRSTLLLMSICGISSIILPFIPSGLQSMSTCFAILAKGGVSAVFFAWYLISSEVIPTLQRSCAMSICSSISRIGSFGSPYLMYLRKYNYWAPNLVMGIASISSGILGIFLIPETLGVNVPDTVDEARENQRFYGLNIARKFPSEQDNSEETILREKDNEKTSMI